MVVADEPKGVTARARRREARRLIEGRPRPRGPCPPEVGMSCRHRSVRVEAFPSCDALNLFGPRRSTSDLSSRPPVETKRPALTPACPPVAVPTAPQEFEAPSCQPTRAASEQPELTVGRLAVAVWPASQGIEAPSFHLTPPPAEAPGLAPEKSEPRSFQPTPPASEHSDLTLGRLAWAVSPAPQEIGSASLRLTPPPSEAPALAPDASAVAVSAAPQEIGSRSFQLTPPASEHSELTLGTLAPAMSPAPQEIGSPSLRLTAAAASEAPAPGSDGPVAVSPAPYAIEAHSFQLRPPTRGERAPAAEGTPQSERAYPSSDPASTTSRELTAKKDGRPVVRLGLHQHDSAWVVECEVHPVGLASVAPSCPGPYTFMSREQARVFLDETGQALRYLGCQVDDGSNASLLTSDERLRSARWRSDLGVPAEVDRLGG